nr:fatty acid desaturase [Escherichia coli]
MATFYAPATSLLATGRRAHLSLVYLGSGLARSRRVYAGHATSGPARLCWLGIFLSRETGALCAVSDTPWLLSDFSFMTILLTYLLSQLLASLIFVTLIIGTHWAKGHTQLPPEEGKMPVGRLAHTFVTTFDWTPQPAWLGYWLGGINLHLTHHLFPHWHHRHYPALSRIIAQIASQQGLDYQLLTLADLLRLQQQFLRRMGEKPKA